MGREMSKKYTIAEVSKMANEFGHVLTRQRPALWVSEMYLDSGGDPEYMTKDEVIEYMESDEWKKEKEWEARNG
jgi:hypothetical protein|tara:strand:- start:1193 stop:1414 length:222 start_codon:yes stop_codon:yes gene_type:complete